MILEGEIDNGGNGGPRIGLALERLADAAPHRAASAITANQITRFQHRWLAINSDLRGHAAVVLLQPDQGRTKAQLDPIIGGKLLDKQAGEAELLTLEAIGMPGPIGDQVQVENDPFAGLVNAVLPLGHRMSQGQQPRRDTVLVQHIQGRRMEGGGAQVLTQGRLRLEHRDRDTPLRQEQSAAQPHRPRADDQHALVGHSASARPVRTRL